MEAEKLFDHLEECFPISTAMSFDNPGLMAGRRSGDINTVYIAVDATDAVIRKAHEHHADLLLTHHPMGLSGLVHVNDQDFIGRRVVYLIENRMRHYAMHTNYDAVRMGYAVGERLELKEQKILIPYDETEDIGIGIMGKREPLSLRELGAVIKEKFDLPGVRIYGCPDTVITQIGVIPGSGKSEVDEALKCGCDVLVTGDVGHHDGLDAVEKGLCLIDAGHHGLEKIFVEDMANWLNKKYSELEIIKDVAKSPFEII